MKILLAVEENNVLLKRNNIHIYRDLPENTNINIISTISDNTLIYASHFHKDVDKLIYSTVEDEISVDSGIDALNLAGLSMIEFLKGTANDYVTKELMNKFSLDKNKLLKVNEAYKNTSVWLITSNNGLTYDLFGSRKNSYDSAISSELIKGYSVPMQMGHLNLGLKKFILE